MIKIELTALERKMLIAKIKGRRSEVKSDILAKRSIYIVTVYQDEGELKWNRQEFKTLAGALRHVAKFVRWGYEARIFRSEVKRTRPLRAK